MPDSTHRVFFIDDVLQEGGLLPLLSLLWFTPLREGGLDKGKRHNAERGASSQQHKHKVVVGFARLQKKGQKLSQTLPHFLSFHHLPESGAHDAKVLQQRMIGHLWCNPKEAKATARANGRR